MATSERMDDPGPADAATLAGLAAAASPVPMAVCDAAHTIQWVNDALADAANTSPEVLVGSAWHSHPALLTLSRQVVRNELTSANGEPLALISLLEPHSQANWAERQVSDAVPGLVTRSDFMDALVSQLDAGGAGTAVILIDIDRFMSFADALGAVEGDRLLVTIATRLRESLRDDQSICHLGGDQFAVASGPARSRSDVIDDADRLLATAAAPVDLGEVAVAVSVSIGVGFAAPSMSVSGLLRGADAALATAKDSGGNTRVVFDDALRASLLERSRLEGELRLALAAERLELHVQPEVDMVDGSVRAVEALIRWPHTEHGLLAADAFVGLAEDAGLAGDLGRWVLGEACRTLEAISDDTELGMRINISALHLSEPGLVDDVRRVLHASGVRPQRLCLEITETAVMSDVERSLDTLRSLHDLGVGLAIDDFGTGFSSLAHLKRFPVQTLKIDRSFVDDMVGSADGAAIVASIVGLAGSLGLDVVAEGVETESQRAALVALGVRRAQGHLFAPALAPEQALAFLAEAPNL